MMPATRTIMDDILAKNPNADINRLHSLTWERMQKYRRDYFAKQIDLFLEDIKIPDTAKKAVRKALIKPTIINGVEYENFLIGIGRKMSQSIQPRSGYSAEYCGQIALIQEGLEKDLHFSVRDKRSDLTLFHPDKDNQKKNHRVEVKNMKIRERGVRGLSFDGDSLFGFFDDPNEFTEGEMGVMEDALKETGGYIYMPPSTIEIIKSQVPKKLLHILRPNTQFGKDMAEFVNTGKIP